MMQITAANTANLSTQCAAKVEKPWKKRGQAQAAAVATIGPHAREGFEFETSKVDGGWRWRATDEVRPDTPAQIKANGGKKHSRLPIPPRREPVAAAGAVIIPPAAEMPPTVETAPAPALSAAQALMVEDGAPVDLMRPPETVEAKAKRQKRIADNTERKIKNPPDAKGSKAGGGGSTKSTGKQSKAAIIATMLMNPKGCTAAEVMKKVGWTKISMPGQARKFGIELRTEKDGNVTRYFAVTKA